MTGLGWGTCFIKHLTNGATGAIHAAPGQTTHTFISEGLWAPTLEAVRNSAHCSPVMTISFSHNDQGKMKIEQFKTNLGGLYDDATKAGAEVIFVSSLSRRNFAADGSVERELAAWAAAMGEVAASKNANFVDFNTASADLIEAAGEAKARTWDRSAKDFTHINDAGCAVFGGLLANMTRTQIPALAPYISADGSPTTSGFAATPTVDTAKCKRGKVKRT